MTRVTCLLILLAFALPRTATAVPPHRSGLELQGKGVQIYACSAAPAGVAWTLKAPDATLRDAAGHIVGHHFAGPTWQATDGSKVVGSVLAASGAPRNSIPWLVLRASETSGEGLFGHVAYVTRTRTIGGMAPAKGCDTEHLGAETRVNYSATYTFFTPPG